MIANEPSEGLGWAKVQTDAVGMSEPYVATLATGENGSAKSVVDQSVFMDSVRSLPRGYSTYVFSPWILVLKRAVLDA